MEAHSPRLLAIARSFARDAEEAHDLVQETWVRAFQRRASSTGSGTLLGWLGSICRRLGLAAASRRSRREAPLAAADRAAAGADPLDLAEGASVRAALHRALHALPPRECEVVILRLVEGRSTRETAAVLGVAEGTVKATLHHAVEKLRTPMRGWAG